MMNTSRFALLAAVLLLWLRPLDSNAQGTLSWDTAPGTSGAQGGTGNWTGNTFWNNSAANVAWANGSSATFGGTAGTVTVNSAVTANALSFTTTGYLIDGAFALTLGGATPTIVTNPGLTATIGANLAGSAGFTKSGTGTLMLTGANANFYTGIATVANGTLNLNKTAGIAAIPGALIIGDNIGPAGSAVLTQGANNQIADTSAVTIASDGMWNLASGNRLETIASLTMTGSSIATGTGTLTVNGDLTTNASVTTAAIDGVLSLGNGTRTFSIADGSAASDLTITASIGNGGITKIGGGTLTFGGPFTNSFTGLMTVADGTLNLNKAGGEAAITGNLVMGDGIGPAGSAILTQGANGQIANSANVTINNDGLWDLATGGRFETVTALTMTGGSVTTGTGELALNGALTTNASAVTATISGHFAAFSGITVADGAAVSDLTISANSDLAFGKAGLGTLTLSGANTTSDSTINAGTLRVSGGAALSDTRIVTINSGATLEVLSDETIGPLAGSGTLLLSSGTLTVDVPTSQFQPFFEFPGIITGSGGFTKAGTGVLLLNAQPGTAGASYSGATTISGGTLRAGINGNTNAIGDTSAVVLANIPGTSLDLLSRETIGSLSGGGASGGSVGLFQNSTLTVGGNNLSTTFAGALGANGSLVKVGVGTLTLTGPNSFGNSSIEGGAVSVPSLGSLGTGTISLTNGRLIYTGSSVSTTRVISGNAGGIEVTDPATTLTLNGAVGVTLTKTGAGRVAVTNVDSLRGLTVNEGEVQLSGGDPFADPPIILADTAGAHLSVLSTLVVDSIAGGGPSGGDVTVSGGTFVMVGNASTNYAGAFRGVGSIQKGGSGTLTLSGSNSYTGRLQISGGTLRLASSGVLPNTAGVESFSTGVFDLNDFNTTIGFLGGSGGTVLLGGATLTIDGGTGIAAPAISGSGGVTKVGVGTQELLGSSTYTGPTMINGGVLRLGSLRAIGAMSRVVLANVAGATLEVSGFAEIGSLAGGGPAGGNVSLPRSLFVGGNGASTTYSGAISGVAGVTKRGAGTLTLNGTNSFFGPMEIEGGTLRLGGGSAIGNTTALSLANSAGVFLDLNNANETIGSLAGGGATGGNVLLGSGTLTIGDNGTSTTFAGVISGSGGLAKAGSGTFTLSGANTFTGATMINAGKLMLPAGLTAAGDVLSVGASGTLQAQGLVNRAIAGSGTITATGALTLGDASSTSGFAFAGTLAIGSNIITLADANAAQLGSATTLGTGGRIDALNGSTLASGRSVTALASATISGSFTNNGTANGPAAPGDFLHFFGDVNGMGNYTGRVRFSAQFSPGLSAAAVSLQTFQFDPSTTLSIELGGPTAGSDYDQLNFTGTGLLDGSLSVSLLGGFTPLAGQSFAIFNGGALAGGFDAISLPVLPTGFFWRSEQLHVDGTLRISLTANTYGEWNTAFGVTGGFDEDDDGDGVPNGIEFLLGTNPRVAFGAGGSPLEELLPVDSAADTTASVTFQIPVDPASDAHYRLRASSDLLNWTTIASKDGAAAWTGTANVTTEPPVAGLTRVTVAETMLLGATQRFHRLEAIAP